MVAENDLQLTRQILQVIFGLDDQTIDRVIRHIRSTAGINPIKEEYIHRRLGTQSYRLLNRVLATANSSEFDQPDQPDQDDRQQASPTTSYTHSHVSDANDAKNEDVNIIKEFLVDIDPDKPEEELNRIRQLLSVAERPEGRARVASQVLHDANEKRNKSRNERSDSPIDNIKAQRDRLFHQAAHLDSQYERAKRREQEEKKGSMD